MSDALSPGYAAHRTVVDRKELDAFVAEEMARPTIATGAPAAPAKPAPKKEAPSALGKGAEAATQALGGGAHKVLDGLYRLLLSGEAHPEDVGRGMFREVASGLAGKAAAAKQVVDGLFELALAPGIGAGEAVQQFMKNVTPGAEQTQVIPGGTGSPARLIRGLLGMPTFKPGMSAEERASADAPMTLGEVANIATLLATTHQIARVMPKGRQDAAPSGAAPTAPEAGPRPMLALPPAPAEPIVMGAGPRPSGLADVLRYQIQAGVIPEAAESLAASRPAARAALEAQRAAERPRETRPFREEAPLEIPAGEQTAGAVVDQFGRPAPQTAVIADERARLRAFEKTPLDQPRRAVGEAAAPEAAGLEGALPSAGEAAAARYPEILRPVAERAEKVITEELGKSKLDEYLDFLFEAEGKPVPTDVTPAGYEMLGRLYQELKDAEAGKRITYTQRIEGKGKEKITLRQPSTYPPYLGELGVERTRKGADKLMAAIDNLLDGKEPGDLEIRMRDYANKRAEAEGYMGERGTAQVEMLTRVALGALLGCASGETEEECVRNGLVGAGLGAALSRRLAPKLAAAMRDETGGFSWARRPRVSATEQPYQPNYNYVKAEADVRRLMKNVHRMEQDAILEQKRGVRAHKETEASAARLIREGTMTPERILKFEPGTILNAEEATAARQLNVGAANRTVEIADRILRGEHVPPGEIRQALALQGAMHRNVRAVQAEAGRVLEAQKIKAHAEHVGPVAVSPADLARLADELGPGLSDFEIAQMIKEVQRQGGTEAVSTFARLSTAIPKAILEAMYGAMLSGKTLLRNVLGNATVMPVAAIDRTLAAYMPRWGSTLPGVLPGEGAQMFTAMFEGMSDQFRMIRHLDAEGFKAQAEAAGAKKVDNPFNQAISSEALLGRPGASPALDWTGRAIRAPLEVLNATDGAFKAVNGRMQLRVEAFRQAQKEGRSGDPFWRRVDELVQDYAQLDDSARARIAEFRDQQTFTKDLEGRVLSALQQGPANDWLNLAYRLTAFTFVRTPLRIAEYAALHTPGLNFLASQFYRDWAAGGVQRQVAQARLVTGGAIISGFSYLAMQGLVTGTRPSDPKLAKLWDDAGYQEKSWWDTTSGKWRSYDGMEPLTTLVATGADLVTYARQLPEADALHLFIAAVMSQVDNFDSKSYTQAISQLKDVIVNPGPDSRVEKAMQYIRQRLASFQPALLREIESAVDPTKRRVRPSGAIDNPILREFQALKDTYRQAIPGLSDAKDESGNFLVPPQRNRITGKELVAESWPMHPFTARTPLNDPVFNELIRLRGAGLEDFPDFLGGRAPGSNVGMTDPALKPPPAVRLTPQERDRLAVLWTQEVKDGAGRTYRGALEALMATDKYRDPQRMSDPRRIELIQRVDRGFREAAEDRLRDESPLLDQALVRAGAERKIRRAPPESQPELRQRLEGILEQRSQRKSERALSESVGR